MSDTQAQNNVQFVFQDYDESVRPIEFKLRSGQVVKCKYFENYMTETNLTKFDKQTEEAEETGSVNDMHKIYAKHLSCALSKIEAYERVKDGKVVRLKDETEQERYSLLRRFSFQDVRLMVSQIASDLGRPLDEDEMSLSAGPAPKEESETAPETPKAS